MEELIGIDVGGTFTDFVYRTGTRIAVHKVPTSPEDQSRAIGAGMSALGVGPHAMVIHGTTTATNALLERRGARTALLTNAGFADVLEIGRQNRPHLYRLAQSRKPPLVSRERRFTLSARLDARGSVVAPLDEDELLPVIEEIRRSGAESLAVVFLFSFLDDVHERACGRLLRQHVPDLRLSLSVDLLPEYREYERTATTVINAYVQPVVGHYMERLASVLGTRPVWVMQSNGGVIDVPRAAKQPARLVLSGPAGGVVGAFKVAQEALGTAGPDVLTFDMGGTSTDVALCPGVIPRTAESVVDDLPLRLPSTHIHTVGAGGGSIARVDAGGALRVGPESAGAIPGPACYGKGGTQVTVTDANVVLGRLDAAYFAMNDALDVEAAHGAMRRLASDLGCTTEVAALGVIRVANATMERALRRVSVEQGHDPRAYTLVPFGGAGPLHACELAEALNVRRILIPRHPGVLSALGLLLADQTFDASRALLTTVDSLAQDLAPLASAVAVLRNQVVGAMQGDPAIAASLDLRYQGQSYELEVPLQLPVSAKALLGCTEAFHEVHHKRYGYSRREQAVECVTVRVQGSLPGAESTPPSPRRSQRGGGAPLERRQVWISPSEPTWVDCFERRALCAGQVFDGPALVLQYDATTLITPGWRARVDGGDNVILEPKTNHHSGNGPSFT